MAHKGLPEQVRRPNRGIITDLPAEGPQEPPPKWPLDKQRPGEAELWDQLWGTPQAYAWHRLNCARVVARYCRLVLRAENAGADGSGSVFQLEVRRLETELGLTPKALHMLNWRIVEEPPTTSYEADLAAYKRAVGDES
jgi:hypothetical protein